MQSVISRTSTVFLPFFDHLPQPERPAEHAHVRMHAVRIDVFDAALSSRMFHIFVAAIADVIAIAVDHDRGQL